MLAIGDIACSTLISTIFVAQGPFEDLLTYPESLTSLTIADCTFEGTEIECLLSKLIRLQSCQVRSKVAPFSLMRTILYMGKLKRLTLFGEADPGDEEAMEGFVKKTLKD